MTKENQSAIDGAGATLRGSGQTLRRRAEDIAREKAAGMAKNVEALSTEEVRQLVHELRVHQIELEMQNEELRRTQREVEASRKRYFDLYDLAPVGYFTLSEAGLILEANFTAANVLGVARSALLKEPLTRFILPDDQDIFYRHRKMLFETGSPQVCEFRMLRVAADPFWAGIETTVAQDADGAPVRRAVMIDITKRKQAERKLRESEEKFRLLVESISDVIYEIDSRGVLVYISPIIRDVLGYEPADIIGKNFIEFVHKDDRTRLMMLFSDLRTGAETPSEYRLTDKSGNPIWVRTKTRPIMEDGVFSGARGTLMDVTERKRGENDLIETVQQLQDTRDMLVQFEKQAAIGRLAAGVAHEILNPASIISSRLQFMEEENLAEPARENLRVSREQLQRIVNITRDLRQSSANHQVHLVSDDFRRVIEVALQMTERRIKDDRIRIDYDPPVETIPIKMAMNRLVKVMVHLILNACEAMTVNEEKILIITIQYHAFPPQNLSMLLTFADNGHGISNGNMEYIFDPFFTTREAGKGTGLGLSVCKGIIQEHGGTIRAEGNAMGGASFIIELPLHNQ